MALTKMVNGIPVPLTTSEQSEIEAEWAENDIKAQEQAVLDAETKAKQSKLAAIDTLKVTTAAGNEFDANTASRAAVEAAITYLEINTATEYEWKLADNTKVMISLAEFKEAFSLMCEKQSAIWLGE